MKIKPPQRNALRVEQLPKKQVIVFQDESILEAYKITTGEKIDLAPVVGKQAPTKVMGVVTSEAANSAHEKTKNLQ
jgi:CBS domain-containing protein